MIEAVIVCVLMNWEAPPWGYDCETWQYEQPMERTAENVHVLSVDCARIIATMRTNGFEVTCEEGA